jgi:hypothetical protein
MLQLTLLLALGAAAPPPPPTILVKKTLDELLREATLVARVRTGDPSCAFDETGSLIWTHTGVEILERWKGDATPGRISEPGGVVGSLGQEVPGAPRYVAGAGYVVFLHQDLFGRWRTTGWIQGSFRVEDGQVRLDPGLRHVTLGHFQDAEGRHPAIVTVSAFEDRVRALLGAGAGR